MSLSQDSIGLLISFECSWPHCGRIMDVGIYRGQQLLGVLEMSTVWQTFFSQMVVSQFVCEEMCPLQIAEMGGE